MNRNEHPTVPAMQSVSEREFSAEMQRLYGGSWAQRKPTRQLKALVAEQLAVALDTAAQRGQ